MIGRDTIAPPVPSNTPWLEPSPPWQEQASATLCSDLGVAPADVPIVEVISAPCSVLEIVAIRAGRFVPLFAYGASKLEAVRALANVARAFGPDADPRGADYALDMATHAMVGPGPL